MSLRQKLNDDLKASMKSGDKLRLSVIRMVQSAVKNKEIDYRGKDNVPSEDEIVLSVLRTLVKQRKESIDQFQKGGRPDLVEAEQAELKVVESYLPAQMSREDVEKIVVEAIASTGATSAKDMGSVMKAVLAKTQGLADGKVVSELVKSRLS